MRIPESTVRRRFLRSIIRTAAGVTIALPIGACTVDTSVAKAKVIFVLFKRPDLAHEKCLAEWGGKQHTEIVRTIPGLMRWVQNHVSPVSGKTLPVGIGELWFADAQSMDHAMASPEMAAAVEDAKRFLDMESTYAVTVDENTIIS